MQVFGVFAPMAPRMDSNFLGAGKSFFFACRPKYKVYLKIVPFFDRAMRQNSVKLI